MSSRAGSARRRPSGRRSCGPRGSGDQRRARRYRKRCGPPPAPHRHAASPPAACTIAAASAIGCITPLSLLASMRETSGRDARVSACASAARSSRPSASTGRFLDRLARKPAARAHRRMLDRRHEQPVARPLLVRRLDEGRQRERVGLGAARGEEHVRRCAPDQLRPPAPARLRPDGARCALRHELRTGCRVPPAHPATACRACLPQRRRGVPVEINALRSLAGMPRFHSARSPAEQRDHPHLSWSPPRGVERHSARTSNACFLSPALC